MKDYRGAYNDFTCAIQLDSTNAESWFQRGKAGYIINKESVADWSKAGELGIPESYIYIKRILHPSYFRTVSDCLLKFFLGRNGLLKVIKDDPESDNGLSFLFSCLTVIITLSILLVIIYLGIYLVNYVERKNNQVENFTFLNQAKYLYDIWNIGNIVQLKNGGPEMLIERIEKLKQFEEDSYLIYCIWFDNNHALFREKIMIELLENISLYDYRKKIYPKSNK
jgi:uncharacterized protein YodC (DUF2158 family)